MNSELLKELEAIDREIRESIGEKNIAEITNEEILVGCGGCSGSMMACSAGHIW